MANSYECVYILTPVLSEDQAKEVTKKFSDFLKSNGANMVHEEHWGLKKLAYPIQKKTTGFYHLMEFECDSQLINTLEVEFGRDERVIRFLTVRMDKHMLAFAERRRNKAKQKKEEPVANEASAEDKTKAKAEKVTS